MAGLYPCNMFLHCTCTYVKMMLSETRQKNEAVRDKAVEKCDPLVFISWLPHLVHSGQAPGQGTVRVS